MADPRPLTRKELAEFLPSQRAIRAFEKLFDLIPSDIIELLSQIDSARNESSTALARTNRNLGLIADVDLRRKGIIFVNSPSDLPLPVLGVITLLDNYTYYFTSVVDLLGSRIVAGTNTAIKGSSPENCRIKSTGLTLGTPLISSQYSLTLRDISLEAETIFNLDAALNPDQALDWFGVNFVNCSDVGTVANYNNFVAVLIAFLGSSGMVFDGTFGTIAWDVTLFQSGPSATNAIVSIPATCTINRRFRVIYSSIVALNTSTGFDVSTSASIPVEGYILDSCNFSGPGTYVAGVQHDDNKSRWTENRGIINSAAISGYYMQGNVTPTVIAATATPVKVAGTTTETTISQRFTVTTTNRATYDGAITRDFKVTAVCSLTSGNGHQIGIYVSKNGSTLNESETYVTTNASGRLENGMVQVLVNLEDADYIEIWVENNTAITDVTVEDLNVIVEALN